jgi:phospholipid-translocating ATPase
MFSWALTPTSKTPIALSSDILPDYYSWSIVTWFIVVGSNVVMLLWVAVYSLFTTSTFTSEFVELLGTIDFWASVILSVVLAVGMYLKPTP